MNRSAEKKRVRLVENVLGEAFHWRRIICSHTYVNTTYQDRIRQEVRLLDALEELQIHQIQSGDPNPWRD